METGDEEPFRMQENSTMGRVVAAWSEAGYWVDSVDDRWRRVFVSDELSSVSADEILIGEFCFSPAQLDARLHGHAGAAAIEEARTFFARVGGWMLVDLPGGRDALREMIDPRLRDLVDDLEPCNDEAIAWELPTTSFGGQVGYSGVGQRVRDSSGRVIGTVFVNKPVVGMTTIGMMTTAGDLRHFERMRKLARAGRRPAAVMFADLEGSTQLSKRLPTATYLTLVRQLTEAADRCVIDAGGLVGRHVGDGVTAFFVEETAGSESAAARACILTARSLQAAMPDIAAHHDLLTDDVKVRVGLHWGATLYIGSIVTPGRTEVTALGDAVNEAARIEACATGGRALASKDLIERLDADDANAVGIDANQVRYTPLADLDTATDKARRDAPAISVCDIAHTAP
jgi:class 3 adenylate cyclase